MSDVIFSYHHIAPSPHLIFVRECFRRSVPFDEACFLIASLSTGVLRKDIKVNYIDIGDIKSVSDDKVQHLPGYALTSYFRIDDHELEHTLIRLIIYAITEKAYGDIVVSSRNKSVVFTLRSYLVEIIVKIILIQGILKSIRTPHGMHSLIGDPVLYTFKVLIRDIMS